MSKVQLLRGMLKLRLTADDEEIFELFDGVVTEYEEEICRLKEENKGWKVLDAVFNPQVHLYRADVQQLFTREEFLPEQQEWNLSVDQEDIKEEQETPCISQQGQQLHQLEEDDITMSPFTAGPLKSENDDEKPQSSQAHQHQSHESTEAQPVASSSAVHRALTAEADGEDDGGPQPASNTGPNSRLQPDTNDVQQLIFREEFLPEQQEWNPSVNHQDIKEEQETPCISQQGQQLHQLEEDDITMSPFTAGPLKSENDDEKPQSSQAHQHQSHESTEAQPVASSSAVHRALTAEADGEDDGGPQPASNTGPNSRLQPDTNDMQQLFIKEEFLLWLSQQGPQLHQLEEDDIIMFPFTGVPVKSENDDEKPQSSHFHQSQTEESTEAEPVASSSTAHRTLTAHADGEDYGGPQPASNSGPYNRLQLDTNGRSSDSSETETDNSCEWQQPGELYSGFNCQNVYSEIYTGLQASEKPFGCPECGKRFGQKCNLITHMKTHTGEKLFVCSDCGKTFGQKGNLIRHRRIHTGEKPFDCSECGTKFKRKDNLIAHMLVHTGEKLYDCSQCGKRFGQKGDLTRHLIVHVGQKLFGCSMCGKRFGHKGSLIRHMRIHTGSTSGNMNQLKFH